MVRIFDYLDYKEFLRHLIDVNAETKGFRSRLADGAGCQKSFLSQVLNGPVQLTPDHAARMGAFLTLDAEEADYLLNLVELGRAGSEHLRNLLLTRLATLRRKQEDLSRKWQNEEIQSVEAEAIYYSSWYMAAVHVVVSIPGFHSVKRIAARLGLEESVTQEALHQLARLGLVANVGQRWQVGEKSLHLGKNSLMAEAHHGGWRQRALLDCQRRREWSTHFSAVFAISRADADLLRRKLQAFLLEMRRDLGPSPEEALYAFTTDLFEV